MLKEWAGNFYNKRSGSVVVIKSPSEYQIVEYTAVTMGRYLRIFKDNIDFYKNLKLSLMCTSCYFRGV